MKYNLHTTCAMLVLTTFLLGCAENATRDSNHTVMWDEKTDQAQDNPHESAPVLVLTKEESAAFLSQWHDKDEIVAKESSAPLDIQSKVRILAMLWGISNENLCNSYNLVEIEKEKLEYTEIKTKYEGDLKFNPTLYSEIWKIDTCGKIKKWHVADNNGAFFVHTILPD